MSEENVELIRENFARFQAGDETWMDFIDPEIEWDFTAGGLPVADILPKGRGREGIIEQVIPTYYGGWVGYEAEITEIVPSGDDYLVTQHEIVHVGDSDTVLERDVFHVWTVRDRMWVRWRIFADKAAALEAIGLGG